MSDEATTPSDGEAPEPEAEGNGAPANGATNPVNALHGPPTGARGAAQHERAAEMVRLRVAFVPVAEIAERYGITAGRCRKIIARELAQNRARAAAEYRDTYAQRYEDLARPFIRDAFGWTERFPEGHPQAGEVKQVHKPDLKAAEFVLKCVNELRRLQGLDKITIVDESASPEERAAGITTQLRAYMQGIDDARKEAEAEAATNGRAGNGQLP